MRGCAHALADVQHRGLVALAFADHDGAAHGYRIHHPAHGLHRNLVGVFAVALAHGVGAGDGRLFHHTHELQRQFNFQVWRKTVLLNYGGRFGLRGHGWPPG